MIKHLKQIFKSSADALQNKKSEVNDEKKLQIATCALLIEMAKADSEFTDDERKKIIGVMKKTFNPEKEYIYELIELSEESVKKSISIYEF